jgi:hypothetical protein
MVEALRHHGGTLTGRRWPGIFGALKQLTQQVAMYGTVCLQADHKIIDH